MGGRGWERGGDGEGVGKGVRRGREKGKGGRREKREAITPLHTTTGIQYISVDYV